MASQIPLIVPNGYYDKLGTTTIRTPIAVERMLGNPNPVKVTNPLFPMTNPLNRSANEAALHTTRVADSSNNFAGVLPSGSLGAHQQLQVINDPSIVKNVPATQAERLQLALEQKAAQIAAGKQSWTPTSVAVDAFTGKPISTASAERPNPGWGSAVGRVFDPSWRPEPSTATAAIEAAVPSANGTIAPDKSAYRLDPSVPNPPTPFDVRSPSTWWGKLPSRQMQWEPALPSGPAPAAVPWGTRGRGSLRIGGGGAQSPGLVTGSNVAQAMAARGGYGTAPAPVHQLSPEVHAALMAQQTDGFQLDQNGNIALAMNGKPARANPFVDSFGMIN